MVCDDDAAARLVGGPLAGKRDVCIMAVLCVGVAEEEAAAAALPSGTWPLLLAAPAVLRLFIGW